MKFTRFTTNVLTALTYITLSLLFSFLCVPCFQRSRFDNLGSFVDSVEMFLTRLHGYKNFSMLNSAEHAVFLLINVKMQTIVGILTFMSRKNSILGLSEPEKS